MTTSIFDQFTNKYSLSKTLRFELKPVGKTKELLEQNNIFNKDKTIDASYNQAKPYFDKLHQEFINEALAPEKVNEVDFIGFADFVRAKTIEARKIRQQINDARQAGEDTDALQKILKNIEDEIEAHRQKLYAQIKKRLDDEAEIWKKHYLDQGVLDEKTLKKENAKGVGFLTSAAVLNILKHRFPAAKDAELQKDGLPSLFVEEYENPGNKRYIFDSFDKFSGYLTKLQETRKNIYDDTGKATAIATRIVSNFELFLANKKTFDDKYASGKHKEIGFERIDVFDPANYKYYLRQSAIEVVDSKEGSKETYNKIIGHINQRVKEYRDVKASEAKREGKKFNKADYPLFKTLEKQILGDLSKQRAPIEARHDASEEEVFIERFQEFIALNQAHFEEAKNFMIRFFNEEFADEYEGIFIKSNTINTISHRWFADSYQFESNLPQASKSKDEQDVVKVKKFVTLKDVRLAVEKMGESSFKEWYYKKGIVRPEQPNWQEFLTIWRYEFERLFVDEVREDGTVTKGYESCLKNALTLMSFSKARKKDEVAKVKNYADAALKVYQLMKYVALDEKDLASQDISTDFYSELDAYAKDFDFIRYYNAFRNFVTKKTYQEDKIKLNFEKGSLLGGWAESPEGNAQFFGYILRKDNRYYLGISNTPTILDFKKHKDMTPRDGGGYYEKMLYRQLKSTSIYGSAYLGKYGSKYSDDKLKIIDQELIERVKSLLSEKYTRIYPELQDIVEANYANANELAKAISALSLYSLEFRPVAAEYIEACTYKSGDKTSYLYLFEIANKDFANGAQGKPNIHTLYFKHLFSEINLKNPTLKLSGGAEVFYRDRSEHVKKRKDKQGKEVIAHKRYTEEKLLFHLPIVINMDAGRPSKFNSDINKFLANNPDVNIIGLDRGEKHLVYYSVINQKGEILDQGSLNVINGRDYYQKLVEREKERRENRQSWNPVAKIKDLKAGYVSQVVRKIVDLAIQYNAIIVMEDLNMRFKQVRGGIERSVYQQLEKQLIDKLNYLTSKDREPAEPGGILNGYQLAAPFETFEKMGKQTGIIFYTQAEYTSTTDPLTGFRKNIYISNSASKEKILGAIERFHKVGWSEAEQSYFFTYNPVDFADTKNKKNILDKEYTIYAKMPRIRREKDENGYWQHSVIDLNKKFRELFELWGFERPDAEDLRDEILRKETDGELAGKRQFDGKERSFYQTFIYLFNLVLNIRNSFSEQWKTETDEHGNLRAEKINTSDVDFIASPVKPFFSTYAEYKGRVLSPQNFAEFDEKIKAEDADRIRHEFNGDANGAYNIARKGIIILKNISKKPDRPDLFISNKDWDKHTQEEWNPTSPSAR